MNIIRKIKSMATDGPMMPSGGISEIAIHKGPTIAITAKAQEYCLPFHIKWVREGIRNDN